MAARAQTPMGPQGTRSKGAMRTPPLQTASNDVQPQTRYSFMETPDEMEISTFQPYHQFSSPTNSTIDESPISPASPSRGLPTYPQISHTITTSSLPVEKAQTEPPQEMHPAFYAPYQEAQPAQQPAHTQKPAVPESPGPIPIKFQEMPHHHARETTITEFLPPPTSEQEEPKPGMGRHNTIYNPDSLQGPNVDLERTHRPGQVSHPNSNVEPHWKNGMCEPDTLCCMGLVCPCMVYGKTMYRLSRKAQKQDPTDLLGYESCNGSCGLMAAACGFQCTQTFNVPS